LSVVWLLVQGKATAAAIIVVFFVLSFASRLHKEPGPHLFDIVFALAALLDALGFIFGFLDRGVPYDRPIHAFTTFSVSLAFFLFYRDAMPGQGALAWATSVFTLGVTVGALWEIFEWLYITEYTMVDTIGDLIADSIGASVAASVALILHWRGHRHDVARYVVPNRMNSSEGRWTASSRSIDGL
jgi:hypothetical protein